MSARGYLKRSGKGKVVESHVVWLVEYSHCLSHAPAGHLKKAYDLSQGPKKDRVNGS